MVDRQHPTLSTVRQCALLDISRSSLYYRPKGVLPGRPGLDEADRPTIHGHALLRVAPNGGLAQQAGPPSEPKTGPAPDADHGATRYLSAAPEQPARTRAQGVPLSAGWHGDHRPAQVWAADIAYLPMARGFLYLVAIMDWYSRYVAWRLSNTLETDFCVEALEEALSKGKPEIFNTD